MKIVRLLGVAFVALLLAMALSELHPDPYLYDDEIFVGSLTLFFAAYFLSDDWLRSRLVRFALLTSIVFLVLWLWYWVGEWGFGLWYPHAPEIVERFIHVSGERDYNAEVSNLFLLVWPSAVFAWWRYERAGKGPRAEAS